MKIVMFAHRGVTDKGLATLQAHKEKQEQSTSIGWIKHNRSWLIQKGITFILGILAGLAIAKFGRLFSE